MATGGSEESPQSVLAGFGLRENAGSWTHAEEQRLGRLLKRVQERARHFRTTAQAWQDEIERIDTLQKQLSQLETRYEENRRLLQQHAGNLVVLPRLQEHQGQLSKRLGELRLVLKRHQNEEGSKLYAAARSHAARRAELLAISTSLREVHERLQQRYHSLAESQEVQCALATMRAATGDLHELGTADPYGEQVASVLAQTAKLLETAELPLYVAGGHSRVDILVNGAPATFALEDAHAETLIPLAQAERLRILPDGPAVWRTLPYGDQQLRVHPAAVEEIHIGAVTLRGVSVYVTADEHADLGARLGSNALDQVDWNIDRGRARIEVRPR